MAKMAADCGSPTNIRPFGPNASGPADFRSAVPCFMAVVSAAGRLPAVKASTHRAARRRQVTDRMRGSLGGKRGEIIPRAALYHRNLDRGCKQERTVAHASGSDLPRGASQPVSWPRSTFMRGPPMLAARVQYFTESVIREMTRLANQHGAVNLGQGMPDFETPEELKEAACRAIKDGFNQYAITWGAPALRRAIAEKVQRFNGISCDP